MTRMPRCRLSATFSAAWRHTLQVRNRPSPSFHSLVCLSRNLGVDAMRNRATACPVGVKRSSGSSTRLPTMVIVVSPAAIGRFRLPIPPAEPSVGSEYGYRPTNRRASRHWSVKLGADDLRTENALVQVELTVELLDRRGLRGEVDDGVDAL